MAELHLSRGLIAQVDTELLPFLEQWKWSVNEKSSGFYYGFRSIHGGKKHVALHRQVLEKKLGRALLPREEADHINRDTLDNRMCNLRLATSSQNKMNRGPIGGRTWKGVVLQGPSRPGGPSRQKPWKATIQVDGRSRHLGYYKTDQEAAYHYNEAVARFHGDFGFYNKVF